MSSTEENVDIRQFAGGNRSKVEIWTRWSVARLTQMRAFRVAGILGRKNQSWRNVSEHSLVVNAVACYIASTLTGSVKCNLIDEASLLHDVTKRLEKEAGLSRSEAQNAPLRYEFLRSRKCSEEIISAAMYTARVPEIFIEDEKRQNSALRQKAIESLVVGYADARVRNVEVVTLEEALDKNKLKIPEDSRIYELMYRFFKKTERYLRDFSKGMFMPEALTTQSVSDFVKQAAC